MAEAESQRKPAASELLGDWRAADRELVAAKESADIATAAAAAAEEAIAAARETKEAAQLSVKAAHRAELSAIRTTETAEMTARVVQRDKAQSEEALRESAQAEADAGNAYKEAQRQGFPKD